MVPTAGRAVSSIRPAEILRPPAQANRQAPAAGKPGSTAGMPGAWQHESRVSGG